jgi:hypothetical protein
MTRASSHARLGQDATLVVGFLAGPVVWAAGFVAQYGLQLTAAATNDKTLLHVVSVVAAVLACAGIVLCFRAWRRSDAGPMPALDQKAAAEGDADLDTRRREREKFLALSGLAMNAFFVLVIVAEAIPTFLLRLDD